MGIASTSPSSLFSVSGNTYLTGGLGIGTTETTAGNLTATGHLSLTSTTATSTIATGGVTIGTSQFVVQQRSGNIGIGTGPEFVVGSPTATHFVLNNNGNVGVGTSTPTSLFAIERAAASATTNRIYRR